MLLASGLRLLVYGLGLFASGPQLLASGLRLLASGSLDQTVRIWDVSTRQCLCRPHFDFVVSCIAFHASGELLAVAAGKRIFVLTPQGETLQVFDRFPQPVRKLQSMAAVGNKLLVTCDLEDHSRAFYEVMGV